MPARAAASSFSLSPPIGSTLPAQGELAGHRDVAAHGDARRSATPARRPSSRRPTGRPWGRRRRERGCGSRARRRSRSRSPSDSAWARANDSAACADSFITSPSCPVRIRVPRPAIDLRLDVQHLAAVGGPGQTVGGADLVGGWRFSSGCSGAVPGTSAAPRRAMLGLRGLPVAAPVRAPSSTTRRATLRASRAISRSSSRSPASRVYSETISRMTSRPIDDLLGGQPRLGDLLRHQVALGDDQLLLLAVAGEAQRLHAVAQRRRDRLGQVRRGDEHDLRQIEGHAQVVVAEGVVLLGVQHLEQRRRRIAAEVGAQLVDLVEQEDRVVGAGLLQPLDDAGPARRRRRCGGGRGSPPRRARRPARCARTCAPWPARSSGPARSCPRRAAPASRGSARGSRRAACARPGSRGCAP